MYELSIENNRKVEALQEMIEVNKKQFTQKLKEELNLKNEKI